MPLTVPSAASGRADVPGLLAMPWALLPAECGCWLGSVLRRRAEVLVTGGLPLWEATREVRPHRADVSPPQDAAAIPGRNGDRLESLLVLLTLVRSCDDCSRSSPSSLPPEEPQPEPGRDPSPTRTLGWPASPPVAGVWMYAVGDSNGTTPTGCPPGPAAQRPSDTALLHTSLPTVGNPAPAPTHAPPPSCPEAASSSAAPASPALEPKRACGATSVELPAAAGAWDGLCPLEPRPPAAAPWDLLLLLLCCGLMLRLELLQDADVSTGEGALARPGCRPLLLHVRTWEASSVWLLLSVSRASGAHRLITHVPLLEGGASGSCRSAGVRVALQMV